MLLRQLTGAIYENSTKSSLDVVRFHIDSERAYNNVMNQFGHVIDWDDDVMTVPRKFWGSVQELAYASGGEAIEDEYDSREEDIPVEAQGYIYNNRDQRDIWTKTFKNEGEAREWADKRNATITSITPLDVSENTADTKIGGRYDPVEFDAKLTRMKAQHQKNPADFKKLADRMQAAYKKDDQQKSKSVAEDGSKAIAHTAKSLENPPRVMQHRAKRDQEREQQLKYRDIAKRNDEAMLPKSAFAGSAKNKLGSAAHLKGKMKRPARQGDLVGGMEENKIKGADGKACWKGYRYNGTEKGKDKCVKVSEDVESIMASLIEQIIKNK